MGSMFGKVMFGNMFGRHVWKSNDTAKKISSTLRKMAVIAFPLFYIVESLFSFVSPLKFITESILYNETFFDYNFKKFEPNIANLTEQSRIYHKTRIK